MRVVHASDLHLEETRNPHQMVRELVRKVRAEAPDLFLFGGDLTPDLTLYREAMEMLSQAAPVVAAIPGNACLWVPEAERGMIDSLDKHDLLLPDICRSSGVHPLWMEPLAMGDTLFVGSYGHYDHSFCPTPYLTEALVETKRIGETVRKDGSQQIWESFRRPGTQIDAYTDDRALFLMLRERLRRQLRSPLADGTAPRRKVALLHTVPFEQGLIYKQKPEWDSFHAFMGGRALGDLLVEEGVDFCVYGHSHDHAEFVERGVSCINTAFGRFRGEEQDPEAVDRHLERGLRTRTLPGQSSRERRHGVPAVAPAVARPRR